MERINLVDLEFNSFSPEEKRVSFITMDGILKNVHSKNKYVTSFDPHDIYYDTNTKLFYFDKINDMTPYTVNSKEEAILNNIVGLSTLAFCSYLKTYDPKDGLLNNEVISKEFDKFAEIFNSDDVNYYRSTLVNGYLTKQLPPSIYFHEYLINLEKSRQTTGNVNNPTLIKATEAGRLMSDRNDEAAFTGQFFLVVSVTSTLLVVLGYILYILSLF